MARKSRKNVGVIGLGIIGSRVVSALRASGYHVYVWNRSPRVVPNFLASPAEVAEVCETIQIFVSDAQALFEVIDGFDDQLTERHTIICNATIGPEATVEAAKLVQEKGAAFLDAPFTGSKVAAEKRELVYYIGGDDDTLKKAEPILAASSRSVVKIGTVGQAATIKIATNMLSAVTVQTLAEALAIVKRSGIPAETLIDALENHGARSPLGEMKLPRMIQGDFEPHFSMKHMFKDVQLAIHIANSLDIDIPATTATAGVMYGGLNRGWADLDFSALSKIYTADEEAMQEALAADRAEKTEQAAADEKAAEKKAAAEEKAEAEQTERVDVKPAGDEEVKPEPPKETLSHLKPPPPREELAAALEAKAADAKAADAKAGDLSAPEAKAGAKDVAPAPEGAVIEIKESEPQRVEEQAKPEPAEAKPSSESAPPKTESVPAQPSSNNDKPAESSNSDKPAAEKPAEAAPEKAVPPNNPIRRWFVARAQNLRQ